MVKVWAAVTLRFRKRVPKLPVKADVAEAAVAVVVSVVAAADAVAVAVAVSAAATAADATNY